MKVMLVDASLYTAPYDAALSEGLAAAGVQVAWATRPARRGDRDELAPHCADTFFYRWTDQARWLPGKLRPLAKGCAHLVGMARLLWKIRRDKPDAVHLQWIVVPLVDLAAMALIRRWCPLILTVHDSVGYNGQTPPWPQRLGLRSPAKLAHRVIVHTRAGELRLRRAGVPVERLSVIPHGALRPPPAVAAASAGDARYTVVLFGEIKPYKGLDVMIEAVAAIDPARRRGLRVVVAGRPLMDLAPCASRIAALGLGEHFELRLRRQTEQEMAALFAEADGFVFPYRQVDASGVYHLVKGLGKWLIASRVGVFAEEMGAGQGALVPPGEVAALARALEHAVAERPRGSAAAPGDSWVSIGLATRALYERARGEFDGRAAQLTRYAGR